jgi:predicted AAA+ superfamily ATPase
MTDKVIGRTYEKGELKRLLTSDKSEFLALYGRRRIGKTYLIRNSCQKASFYFELTGQKDAPLADQLENFAEVYGDTFLKGTHLTRPRSWRDAFNLLRIELEKNAAPGKKVIFLDELPWLASPRSGFMQALDYFWNHWASRRDDILLIICGSAASWMIKKVIHDKGGLHNRITARMRLLPFTLSETKDYFISRKISLNHRQVTNLYMAMGGVPFYLQQVQKNKSAAQNIDSLAFSNDGMLVDEFEHLFSSLFDHAEHYISVVRSLANPYRGMTRDEIIKAAGLKSGGGVTEILIGLEQSGFIASYVPFGKNKKETLYYLIDEYCIFYLAWIERAPRNVLSAPPSGYWQSKEQSRAWSSWSGYAFERICQKHAAQIKKALGVSGIQTVISSWAYRATSQKEKGVQIDLVIDRNDRCITLCEMKYYDGTFTVTKQYAKELQDKVATFKRVTKTKKTVFLALVTTEGIVENDYSHQLVDASITLQDLYQK